MDHCDECGFVYADVAAGDLPRRLAEAGPRFAAALAAIPDPRRRPAPEVWSPLEYTCHVRDVLQVQTARLALALATDNPSFAPMGRAERAVADAYNTQDPPTVAAQLTEAADTLATAFGAVTAGRWTRTGVYNWPTVRARTVLWLGRHTVHEVEHHLRDVTR
jgi:hypothetical protein